MALASKSFSDIITFSRSSAATRVNASGLVESVAAGAPRFDFDPVTLAARGILIEEQRTNLLTYSQDFDNAAWSKFGNGTASGPAVTANAATAPDGTTSADLIVFNRGAGNTLSDHSYIAQVPSATSGSHTQSVWLKAATAGDVGKQLGFRNVGAASYGVITLTADWVRYTRTETGATGNFEIANRGTLTADNSVSAYVWGAQLEAGAFATSYIPSTVTFTGRSSTGTFIGSNGLIQTASAGVARYQYNPENLSVPPFLLLEESRTNLYLGSDNFAYTYNKYLSSISTNVAVSPSGATDADKMVEDTNTGPHRVEANFSATSGVGYTFSVFVKAAGRTQFTIFAFPDNGVFANQTSYFDLSAGTVLSGTGASIASVGNGWFRCSMTLTAGATATGYWGFGPAVGGNSSYAGDGTSGVFLWGSQIEAGSYPTSYIPTTTATVTRAADTSTSAQTTRSADVASVNTLSPWYNASEGTLIAEVEHANSQNYPVNAALTDASASNNQIVLYTTSVGTPGETLFVRTGGVLQANINGGSIVANNTPFKIAGAYKANDFSVSLNGAACVTDTSGDVPTVDRMHLGASINQSNYWLNGRIRRLTYYPRRLSNTELQALTA